MKTMIRTRRAAMVACAAFSLMLLLSGCNSATLFGRPDTYDRLASSVTDGFAAERYDIIKSLVITNDDLRKMGEDAEGDPNAAYSKAEEKIQDSYFKVRQAGKDAGILWNDVRMTSSVATGARNKYKEKVDVKVNLDSRGNHYQFLIRNAQRIEDGVVLTDGFEWLGER